MLNLPDRAASDLQRTGGHRRSVVIAALAALLYAALSAAVAFDRAAASDSPLAQLVPEPFRQVALRHQTKLLIDSGLAGSADNQARLLVSRDPVGINSAALLGNTRLVRGDDATAQAAFRVAARLGWRDASTQVFWLRVALDAGDYRGASLRFGALARQWPHAPAVSQLAALFEAGPRGRAALAERIAAGEPWGHGYADPWDDDPPVRLAGRANVLQAVAELRVRLGCDAVARLTAMLAKHDPLHAAAVWRSHCSRGAAFGALADGNFASARAVLPVSPFDWEFPGDGALDSMLMSDATGGQQLELRNVGTTTLPVAAQLLAVAPGTYRISWRSSGGNLSASLSCHRDRVNAQPRAGVTSGDGFIVILRFGGECPAPWLQLWLPPDGELVQLDDVTSMLQ